MKNVLKEQSFKYPSQHKQFQQFVENIDKSNIINIQYHTFEDVLLKVVFYWSYENE